MARRRFKIKILEPGREEIWVCAKTIISDTLRDIMERRKTDSITIRIKEIRSIDDLIDDEV